MEQSRLLEPHIDGAQLVILKEASHLSNIEQTEAFNEAMMTFLQEQA
jgi:pimeloyl-ACP methyl ester carboxylesterase